MLSKIANDNVIICVGKVDYSRKTWSGNREIYNKMRICPKSWMGYRKNREVGFTLEK